MTSKGQLAQDIPQFDITFRVDILLQPPLHGKDLILGGPYFGNIMLPVVFQEMGLAQILPVLHNHHGQLLVQSVYVGRRI